MDGFPSSLSSVIQAIYTVQLTGPLQNKTDYKQVPFSSKKRETKLLHQMQINRGTVSRRSSSSNSSSGCSKQL